MCRYIFKINRSNLIKLVVLIDKGERSKGNWYFEASGLGQNLTKHNLMCGKKWEREKYNTEMQERIFKNRVLHTSGKNLSEMSTAS